MGSVRSNRSSRVRKNSKNPRLGHIHEHPEMVGQERRIREVLQEPDIVFTSHKDSSVHVYYRHYARRPVGSKHLMVAVKIFEEDAFVITAFFTDE
jgi:hypothetical protein